MNSNNREEKNKTYTFFKAMITTNKGGKRKTYQRVDTLKQYRGHL